MESSTDADALITRIKDLTTHLAYKAEHVLVLESYLLLDAQVRLSSAADAATLAESVLAAE